MKEAPLIILDIDETLIHACSEWIGRKPDFIAANQMIFVRPFAKEFINRLMAKYKVAIWSAAYGQYLSEIINKLFDKPDLLAFIWDRSCCSLQTPPRQANYFAKDLNRLSQTRWCDNYILIDDRPEYIIGELSNIISVLPFLGSIEDKVLLALINKIEKLTVVEE